MDEMCLVVDERNITRLLYRYAHALDGRDADAWRSCFTGDATFVTRHGTFVDRVTRGSGDGEWRFEERRIVPEAEAA